VKIRSEIYTDYLEQIKENYNQSLGLRIEELAVLRPSQAAVVCQEETLTYEELNHRANRYAAYFNTAGYSRGDVVALMMDNSASMIAAVIGLSKLGIISALLNTTLRAEGLARDINLCDARAILIGSQFIEPLEKAKDFIRLRDPGEMLVYRLDSENMELPAEMKNIKEALPQHVDNPTSTSSIKYFEILAYLFTAGSGGHRKTVPMTHIRWLVAGKAIEAFTDLNENRTQYMCLPLYMSSGFNACFAGTVAAGSTLVVAQKFSASNFWNEIIRSEADYFFGVGEMFRYLYNQERSEEEKSHSLEIIISNGMAEHLMEPFKKRFRVPHILETYNTTENIGTFINTEEIPGMCGNLELAGIRQGELVLYDIMNDKIITDQEGRAMKCARDDVGLLLCAIYDYNDFAGYINDPGEREAVILRDVFTPGDKYFNTNDLMQLHDQDYISFVQRLGGVYRWKGRTISAYKVSDVIKKFFGAIDDAYVFSEPIPGFEGACGMAVITLIEGEKLNWKKFNNYIKRRLPVHERPLFLRISKEEFLDEELKQQYREEGANPRNIAGDSPDELYVYDVIQEQYIELTEEIYEQIVNHEFVV